ncbi:MAG: TonB-dependent receptor [Burkholderiales bacterium]|nr:TonB-dependent receptor [Burkholderiales bacterium]
MIKMRALDKALLLAFGTVLSGTLPAQAQVTITGSSIRQISSETALPVTVLKADELAKAGVTNAEQALAFVTSNQSSINSAFSVGGVNGGASFADLRGLGPARTLVLLNGKRLVMNPYDSGNASGVDLNTIPYGAIDRIEVLNDGASALYGSDAVAGVVNFITRTEYQGLSVSGSAQLPTSSGGGQVYDITVTGGIGSLSEQKWNLFGGLSYRKQQALSALDRGFASSSDIPDRGVYYSSFTTFPANYYQSATLPDDVFNPTAPGCNPPDSLSGGSLCYFDYVRFLNIVPTQEQLSAIVKGTLAVDNDNTVSLEYVQGNNKLTSVVAPSAISWSMPSTNPFYPGGTGLSGVPGTAANSTPGFDANAPIDLDWRTVSMGSRISTFDNKTDRFLLDWQGSRQGWFYSAAILQSNSNVTNTFNSGYVNQSAMRAGLEGTAIPGTTTVAPWLNPFGSQTADGTAYMNSQRILGQMQKAEGQLFGMKAEASGEIYKLPAGPLTMGVGLEYYRDRVNYTNNPVLQEAASSGLEGSVDAWGARSWIGAFAEFNIPVVKNVDLSLAARYDDYSDFGGTFNPKAAIRWTPTKDLLVRGSINSGFRAPSLYQAYSPTSITNTAGNRLDDPVLCPGGVADTAAGGVAGRDCGQSFYQQLGGNTNLQPETSTAWSVGLVFQPTASSTVSVDYWNYTVKDSISQLGENAIFNDPTRYASSFVRCSQLSPSEQAAIDRCAGSAGGDPLAYIVNTWQNLGNYKTSGLDFSAGWRSALQSFGRFSVGWQATWVLDYEYQFEAGGAYNDNLGIYFNGQAVSRYRQFLNLGWQYENWSANLINRYSRGYTDDNSFVDPAYYNTVGATNTWDLAVTWTGLKGLVMTAGITNLFDQEPPFSNQGTLFQVGYDARYASPIGRAFLLRASYAF